MKRLLLFVALCTLGFGARAQVSGTLLTTGDIVQLNIDGAHWATARFVFATGTSQTLEFATTNDGVNWLPSGQGACFVKRLDAVSANPTIVFGSTATMSGASYSFNINTYGASTWELPLAANVQAVRVKALSTITSANLVTVNYGLPYQLGVPVAATYADLLTATNTALLVVGLDLTGWSSIMSYWVTVGGSSSSAAMNALDDAGSSIGSIWASGGLTTVPTLVAAGSPMAAPAGFTSGLNMNPSPLPHRVSVAANNAGVGNSIRLRIEIRR